jgi:oligogalacturonide lyase
MHTPRPESPRSANCQLLYFTTGSVTADNALLVAITNAYSSHAEGASLARIERSTGRMEPLATFAGPAMQSYPYFARPRSAEPREDYLYNGTVATHGLNKSSPCLDPATGNLYFVWGSENGVGQLDSVNLRDGRRRRLCELPHDRCVGYTHLDPSGRRVLLSLMDSRILGFGERRKGNQEMSENHAKFGLTTQIAEVDVETGKLTVRWEEPAWVTHVQYHPKQRDLVLYNHEWTWPLGLERIWMKRDGQERGRVRRAGRPIQFRVSPDLGLDDVAHEVWQENGEAVIYHGVRWDAGEYPEQFVGRAPIDPDLPLQEILIPRDRPSFYGHFFPSRKGDFVITDAVANETGMKQRKGNLISRLNMDWANGRMEVVPLCESNTSWHTQDNHPHPVLTPISKRCCSPPTAPACGRSIRCRRILRRGDYVNGAVNEISLRPL